MTKDIAHHLNIGSRINLPACVAVAKHMRPITLVGMPASRA